MSAVTITAADLVEYNPEYPKVMVRCDGPNLVFEDGREYLIPSNPVKAFGLVDHLLGKTWFAAKLAQVTIRRMADAMGWTIHPF